MEVDPVKEPLLPRSDSSAPSPMAPRRFAFLNRYQRSQLWPLLCLLILTNLATSLYTLPLNRVIELRLCREHYQQHEPWAINPDGSIPEQMCKIDDVQRKLAWLQGIMETTYVVCDFVVTIPFSFIARRFGIRVVFWCNLVPRIFMSGWALAVGNLDNLLPTKAIIAGPFLAVFGGECVFTSTVFTLASALKTDYVERASYFSYISSIAYIVNFIGPSLSSILMSYNLWSPFWVNIALLLLAIPIINALPTAESSNPPSPSNPHRPEDSETGPLLVDHPPNQTTYAQTFKPTTRPIHTLTHTIRTLTTSITGRRNFQILLTSFFLTALASSDTKLLVQYISKRYSWTFARAGLMLSAKALVNFTLLTLIVPRIIRSSLSSKTVHGSETRLNYLGAQTSILISVVGVLGVALAARFWMLMAALVGYALGSALPVFTMSLVKAPGIALVKAPELSGFSSRDDSSSSSSSSSCTSPHRGPYDSASDIQDFSIVMLTKTLGSLVGAPLMTVLWVQAIKIGGAGLGLPYFVSGAIYATAVVVVARLKI
ncbi:hypothetical protein K491DRAFT_694262 [Lophiostoma macrostomum CBS 122681]|uniref:MFS general substrate transporter n=1 Tax=Lophiostoma macrostomum CBS 122681 TaxID=1314788 RepID=A0A6A6T5X5_9PLEO|nr:hypothetical protein K491DRAFT_694262 [Lophiostoma macrostomum CBS 122681]